MADNSDRPIRVLSFDGGGVRGLSSILILEHIMRAVNDHRQIDGKEPLEPWQHFDLIGGTSTGGIIAIMLGRLRMTISECIEAYCGLSKAIFTPKHSRANPVRGVEYLNGEEKFDSQVLEKEIKAQISKSKVAKKDDEILLKDSESPCKVCVFALRVQNSNPAIFRTYSYPGASLTLFNECKVWEACRATSAAPTFFDPVQIGPYKQSFIDGGLGYNNPIFKIYDEARKIWKDRTIIVTSIGTGEAPGDIFGGSLKKIAKSIAKIVTDCDRVADEFYNVKEDMVKEGHYYRLSVSQGLANIGLEEHEHIGAIVDHTQVYLSRGEPQAKLNMCIEALLQEHDTRRLSGHNDFKSDVCLESLKFKEMDFRKENIVTADDDTCGWLLENGNYSSWVQNDNGLLWIQGKAGAGKSTLMKYIYEKIQTPTIDASVLKLSFFFHARGIELQRTPLGMLKSLLLQLYKGDSTSRTSIRKKFDKNSEDGMVEVKWDWTEKMLEELFSNLVSQISRSRKVTVFVDALDEAGEEVANGLVTYLANLYEKVQRNNGTVKICFSSRHYPILPEKVAENQKVVVEHENARGIQSFIQQEFEQNLQEDGLIKSKKLSLKLEGAITAKANGVFQWVCLVLPIIFKADREAKSLDSIEKILDGLPKDLNDIYKYILRDLISQEQQAGVLKLFRWVCFAARPLSVEEIQHAMAVVDSLPPLQVYNLKNSDEYVEHGMEKRIKALSGGLIEVRAHDSGTVVQVNHQTVRDFFLKEGFEILTDSISSPSLEKHSKGFCHDILARLCINYLWTEGVQKQSSKLFWGAHMIWPQLLTSNTLPLLQYAIAALFWHASNAEQNGFHQERLLEQFNYRYTQRRFKSAILEEGVFSLWRSAGTVCCLRDYFGVFPSNSSTLLHIASMANIQTAVKILLGKGAKVGEQDEFGQQAIHYAARGGAMEVSEMLINLSSHMFSSSVINAKDSNSVTPLQMAARHYKDDVMRLLITKGAKAKCLKEENSWELKRVQGDMEKTVSLLLEDAATFNVQTLQDAAASGNLARVQLLLAEGTDVNAKGGLYGCALVAAVRHGHYAVAEALLQSGAEIDAQDGMNSCALTIATQDSDEQMVKMLLSRGANINAEGGRYGNALAVASHNGYKAMVRILLEQGAEINTQSGEFGNALTAAAYNGRTEIIHMLLEGGASINATSGKYGNALIAAVLSRNEAVAILLLDEGAENDAQYGEYTDALAIVLSRKEAVIMLLLDGGAQTNTLSGEYTNALALAGRAGDVDVVQALLKAKAEREPFLEAVIDFDQDDISTSLEVVLLVASHVGRLDIVEGILAFNKQGRQLQRVVTGILSRGRLRATGHTKLAPYNGYTALQLSVVASHPEIVARLLAAGVNVDDAPVGRTVLQAAAKNGNIWIIKSLLNAGANANAYTVGYSRTALQAAVKHGHLEIVEKLIAAGAYVDSYTGGAFQVAAGNSQLNAAGTLLATKAGPYATRDKTALQEAAQYGHAKIVKVLLAAGAHVDAFSFGYGGGTPLREAARHGHLEIVKTLLAAGANLNASKSWHGGGTALQEAAEHGHLEIVKTLLAAEAIVNASNSGYGGGTALQEAAQHGHSKIVKTLLAAGVNVDASNSTFGVTALRLAVQHARHETVEVLLASGADPNATANALNDYTTLQIAAKKGDLKMVNILLGAGAYVNTAGSKHGRGTALDEARDAGQLDIVDKLASVGGGSIRKI